MLGCDAMMPSEHTGEGEDSNCFRSRRIRMSLVGGI